MQVGTYLDFAVATAIMKNKDLYFLSVTCGHATQTGFQKLTE